MIDTNKMNSTSLIDSLLRMADCAWIIELVMNLIGIS